MNDWNANIRQNWDDNRYIVVQNCTKLWHHSYFEFENGGAGGMDLFLGENLI